MLRTLQTAARTHRYAARCLHASLAVAMLIGTSAAHADDVDTLTQNLVKLRGEVETLNAELEATRTEHDLRARTLLSRKGELENQIERQALQNERLNRDLEKLREQSLSADVDGDSLRPAVTAALDAIDQHIATGLPFKLNERTAAVAEIRKQLDTGVISPKKAVNRVWGFYEDEIRLARENGLYRQPVELGKAQVLAQVARLGMTMMYFRTEDQQVGYVVKDGARWQYRTVSDSGERERIDALFDAFGKQIRTGYFELPNPLAGGKP